MIGQCGCNGSGCDAQLTLEVPFGHYCWHMTWEQSDWTYEISGEARRYLARRADLLIWLKANCVGPLWDLSLIRFLATG
jgi:hypothetical protein